MTFELELVDVLEDSFKGRDVAGISTKKNKVREQAQGTSCSFSMLNPFQC
ncbi:MAG: hypothetical protein L3J88_02725 [Gammaproteobacteria bacterium]|nr:hypothetical protein [Gammaproteobacteria bacterium]MCF6362268.1 hypothetical protein [Gammaproteobacteria bacterium]